MVAVSRALILVAGVIACADALARDKGFAPSTSTATALAQTLEPRRYALVVGVDEYDDPIFPSLHHAGADAEALGDAFVQGEGGGFDDVVVLTGTTTRRSDVLRALLELKTDLRREDTVVVYFSGHGTRVLDEDRWRRFLLLADSRSSDLEATALDLAELQAFFSGLPAARKALIIDACFTGDGKSVVRPETLGFDASPDAPPPEPLLPRTYVLGPGEAQMFATTEGRPSREDDRLGHGVYTYYLLEAMSWGFQEADLDGDDVLSAYEAHDYARGRTIVYTDAVQVPEAAFRVVGEADLLLAGDPARRRARENALLYLYSSHGDLATARVLVDGRDRGVLPGTIAIEPGRHHVALEDGQGEVMVEGFATLSPGQSLRFDDLARQVQGPDRMFGLRAASLTSAPLRSVIGSRAFGGEIWAIRRVDQGPARGLFGELVLGAGSSSERQSALGPVVDARALAWIGLSAGYQADWRRIRYRAGLGVGTVVIPPDGLASVDEAPSEVGWWLVTAGPTAGLGYVVSGGWTLVGSVRVQGASLDVGGTGETALVPVTTGGLGLEIAY